MPSFKDSAGREWTLTIDPVEIRRVRERTGVYLGLLSQFLELDDDVIKFVDVLWVLCEPQDKNKVGQEAFQRSIVGDVCQDAKTALKEAFLFFCPTPVREAIRELERRTQESPSETWNSTAGSSAESAESTPTPAG